MCVSCSLSCLFRLDPPTQHAVFLVCFDLTPPLNMQTQMAQALRAAKSKSQSGRLGATGNSEEGEGKQCGFLIYVFIYLFSYLVS